jgi:hypothetical protein
VIGVWQGQSSVKWLGVGLMCSRDRHHAWDSHSFISDPSSTIKLLEHKSDHSVPSVSNIMTACFLPALGAWCLCFRGTFIFYKRVSNKMTKILWKYVMATLWTLCCIVLVRIKNHSVLGMDCISAFMWTACGEILLTFCTQLLDGMRVAVSRSPTE